MSTVFLTIFVVYNMLLQPSQQKLPEGKWFCCSDCHKIHTALEKLVVRGPEALPNSLSNVIRQKHSEKSSSNCADLDVRWRLLSGRITSSDSRLLLSKAVAIFHVSSCPR